MQPRQGTHRIAALTGHLAALGRAVFSAQESGTPHPGAEMSSPDVLNRKIRLPLHLPSREPFQAMRTEQSVPIRLDDYRPPDWLVETVDLDVSLQATAARVRAALRLKPNPKATAPAPLVLDGDGLKLVSLKLDGETLKPDRFAVAPDSLTIAQPPRQPFTLEIETVLDPSANTQLMGLY